MRKKIGRKERMLAGGNEKFPPANILSFLPSHYNDYHAFVSSTEHGFFRILGEMSLRGQEKLFFTWGKIFLHAFWQQLPWLHCKWPHIYFLMLTFFFLSLR
jgi:hypothetical protein